MILGFKKYFDDGTDTLFHAKIVGAMKIHSIRAGQRWEAGKKIHMAYGVRTKNYSQFNKNYKELQTCIDVQDIFMTCNYALEITIDDRYLMPKEIDQLIKNDGLTREQFINWFFKDTDQFSGQIIHWTNFKY